MSWRDQITGLIFDIFSNNFKLNNEDFFGVKTIVIDAGHGGKDGGCVGLEAKEKDVALAIALKLGKQIEDNFNKLFSVFNN